MSKPASPARRKWCEILERQRASGMSVAAFCRRNGVAACSFFAWKRRIGSSPVTPVFIEAKVASRFGSGSPKSEAAPAARPAGGIEVRLRGGRRVRVGRDGFDRDLLAQVIAVLEGLS